MAELHVLRYARSKKPASYYARVLKEAHRRAVEELAVALDISEEDLLERIGRN